jgi:CobQ-like glutamine amidotransferase family enzyme
MGAAYEEIVSPTLVGFENHSGQTYAIDEKFETLGKVEHGKGNNAKQKLEGFRFQNVIGSYSHGPILPKNPHLADFLIYQALQNKYGDHFEWVQLDDAVEWQAHMVMKRRLLD